MIVEPAGERACAHVVRGLPYVTGRTKVVLEEPGFEIEAMRIHMAMRPLESREERPALACVHNWSAARIDVIVGGLEPTKRDPSWNLCVVRFDETGTILETLWDLGGENHPMITSMREHKGHLYIGGIFNNRVGRLKIEGANPNWTGISSYWGQA